MIIICWIFGWVTYLVLFQISFECDGLVQCFSRIWLGCAGDLVGQEICLGWVGDLVGLGWVGDLVGLGSVVLEIWFGWAGN